MGHGARSVICVLGRTGRIGRELVRLAEERGLAVTDDLDAAGCVLLALPGPVARERLVGLRGRSVIDMSGAVKHDRSGLYGLRVRVAEPMAVYGNPGCIAGAAICAIRDGGVRVEGPLHITAVGGASYAHRDQTGTVRVARRWLDHPHVREVEDALGCEVGSFVPLVAYGHERGLVVTVSGRGQAEPVGSGFDVAEVVGTAAMKLRVECGGDCFTAVAGIDNLTWPAAQAIGLAERLLPA